MQITSGSEWVAGNGRRNWSISLSDDDAKAILGEKWDVKTWDEKRDWLSKRADLEVLAFMVKEGAIPAEYAMQRAREIKAR